MEYNNEMEYSKNSCRMMFETNYHAIDMSKRCI